VLGDRFVDVGGHRRENIGSKVQVPRCK
jgi:hypothetical protein